MIRIRTVALRHNIGPDRFEITTMGWRKRIMDSLVKWGWLTNATEPTTESDVICVDEHDFVSQLFTAYEESMRYYTPYQQCKIIMGSREFAEMNHSRVSDQRIDLIVTVDWMDPGRRILAFDLPIQVVPWIEGVVVVPV